MFKRDYYLQKIEQHFHVHSVCAILGPRQVGKTTLARTFVKEKRNNICPGKGRNHRYPRVGRAERAPANRSATRSDAGRQRQGGRPSV